jgi:hypothetical protein
LWDCWIISNFGKLELFGVSLSFHQFRRLSISWSRNSMISIIYLPQICSFQEKCISKFVTETK